MQPQVPGDSALGGGGANFPSFASGVPYNAGSAVAQPRALATRSANIPPLPTEKPVAVYAPRSGSQLQHPAIAAATAASYPQQIWTHDSAGAPMPISPAKPLKRDGPGGSASVPPALATATHRPVPADIVPPFAPQSAAVPAAPASAADNALSDNAATPSLTSLPPAKPTLLRAIAYTSAGDAVGAHGSSGHGSAGLTSSGSGVPSVPSVLSPSRSPRSVHASATAPPPQGAAMSVVAAGGVSALALPTSTAALRTHSAADIPAGTSATPRAGELSVRAMTPPPVLPAGIGGSNPAPARTSGSAPDTPRQRAASTSQGSLTVNATATGAPPALNSALARLVPGLPAVRERSRSVPTAEEVLAAAAHHRSVPGSTSDVGARYAQHYAAAAAASCTQSSNKYTTGPTAAPPPSVIDMSVREMHDDAALTTAMTPRLAHTQGYAAPPPQHRDVQVAAYAARVVGEKTERERERLLHARLADAEQDAAEERQRREQLEAKVLELQSHSTLRVLEGKVAGLQKMLEDKSRECERAVADAQAAHVKLETLLAAGETARRTAESLEQQLGQRGVESSELSRQLEKHRNEITSLEQSLDDSYRKLQEGKRAHEEQLAACDAAETALRGELRGKARQLQDVEMEKLSLVDDMAATRAEMEVVQQALRHAEGENEGLRERLAGMERAMQRQEAEDAQRRVVADGVRGELDREAAKAKALVADLRVAEQQRSELEVRLRTAEQQVAHLQSFEHHNQHLRDSLTRLEDDLKKEATAHQATKAELAAAGALRDDMASMQKKLHQAESEVTAKAESLARLHTHLESHAATLSSMRGDMDRVERERAQLETELEAAEHYRNAMNQRIIDLERDAQRAHELEGKFRAYESMFEERGEELRVAQHELADQRASIGELERRLADVPRLEQDIEDAHGRVREQQQEILLRREQTEALEADLQCVAQQRDELTALLDEERALGHAVRGELEMMQREYEVQAAAAAQIPALESHVDALRRDLDQRNASVEQHCRTGEQLEMLLHQAETQRDELDAQVKHQHRVIEDLQVDLGRFTVLADESQKEIGKLQGVLRERDGEVSEWHKAAAAHQHQVQALEAQLADAKQDVAELKREQAAACEREACLAEKLSEAEQREAGCARTVGELEARMLDLEGAAMRCSTYEGKVTALAAANEQKAEELRAAANVAAELRSRVAVLQGEAEQVRTMEARIGDLRAQMAAQLAEIEALEGEEARKSAALQEARKELEREVDRGAQLQKQVAHEKALRAEALDKLREAEGVAASRGALEGKISGLEILVKQKEGEVDEALRQADAARRRVKEVESELAGRARVEDVVEEARYQLSVKDDTIARLEREEVKRRAIVDEQYAEIVALSETTRKMDTKLQEEGDRRVEAEARVEELLREGAVKHRAEDASAKELRAENERLSYDVKTMRERMLQLERTARLADQKISDAHDDAGRLRLLLQQTESTKGSLGAEAEDLRRQLQQERVLVDKLSKDLSEARAEASSAREKEQRATRAFSDQSRETRLKSEQRLKTLESRTLELEAENASLERVVAQLRDEAAQVARKTAGGQRAGGAAAATSPHKPYDTLKKSLEMKDLNVTSGSMGVGGANTTAVRDGDTTGGGGGGYGGYGGVVAREVRERAAANAAQQTHAAVVINPNLRSDNPTAEWERTKENVAMLKSQLRHA